IVSVGIYVYILFSGLSAGDDIAPENDRQSGKEGESVTLSCKYSANSDYILLYWYRQNPNQAPQYLLYKGAGSYSIADKSSGKASLSISREELEDSTVYYCALVGKIFTPDPATEGASLEGERTPQDGMPGHSKATHTRLEPQTHHTAGPGQIRCDTAPPQQTLTTSPTQHCGNFEPVPETLAGLNPECDPSPLHGSHIHTFIHTLVILSH
uniref:Ig-like domain-containing protein n=1 Tax=Scleropages formosus TaxID=113540 RepID=A0A8C9VSH0_SCLFO